MGLLLTDTRDPPEMITDIKLFKNERRIPQPQVKPDSAQILSDPALDDSTPGTKRSTYKCSVQY